MQDDNHWLTRPGTIRRLWIGFALVLALTVLAQVVIGIKGYFGIDGTFGFAAMFGFGCCLFMVLGARALGTLLKRPENYFDD